MRDMMAVFELDEKRKVQNIKLARPEMACNTCIKADVCRLMRASELIRHQIRDAIKDAVDELECGDDAENFSFEVKFECKRWVSK